MNMHKDISNNVKLSLLYPILKYNLNVQYDCFLNFFSSNIFLECINFVNMYITSCDSSKELFYSRKNSTVHVYTGFIAHLLYIYMSIYSTFQSLQQKHTIIEYLNDRPDLFIVAFRKKCFPFITYDCILFHAFSLPSCYIGTDTLLIDQTQL